MAECSMNRTRGGLVTLVQRADTLTGVLVDGEMTLGLYVDGVGAEVTFGPHEALQLAMTLADLAQKALAAAGADAGAPGHVPPAVH